MGVVIETEVWESDPSLFVLAFVAGCLSICLLPHWSDRAFPPLHQDLGNSSSSQPSRFQRRFLLVYSLSALLDGFWLVFGEYELAASPAGVSREQMVSSLCAGCLASLLIGSFLGMLSDVIGHKKVCYLFSILHLVVAVWKKVTNHPTLWVASICLSLSSSIFSFSFETWMVIEHEKLAYRQDLLNDTFWLMVFTESASLIGSQMLANWAVGSNGAGKHIMSFSTVAVLLAIINFLTVARGWTDTPTKKGFKDYCTSLLGYILGDKRILLLACSQACLHFSAVVFWILWAPTIVADGREVHLGLIFPILMGAKMLGSSAFPWFMSALSTIRTEDCLIYAFTFAGLVLSIVAYDYQEVGVLVALFCLYLACAGLILPSLARLRTMYVPNECRGGMISLSLAPANAAFLLALIHGGYYRNIYNSTITAYAALSLFVAAGCMHKLKQWGKQPNQDWHKQ